VRQTTDEGEIRLLRFSFPLDGCPAETGFAHVRCMASI
jgi:hypothetical protein